MTVSINNKSIDSYVEKAKLDGKPTNRLIEETSPYLLQHAFQPVKWYAWGDDAFARAEKEQKPIFLSIGYSTCHWCHVMAHESFDNPEIAAFLNEHFIAIKVDREERPDLDQLYMQFAQAISGRGGWPLSIFMTPAGAPFFAGTYFPPRAKFGQPGFVDVLQAIHSAWQEKRENLVQQADSLVSTVKTAARLKAGDKAVTEELIRAGYEKLSSIYDKQHGGFGEAPKFPQPGNLLFLLRYAQQKKEAMASAMALKTLSKMAEGGMYDQLAGGFHRYSVDAHWLVPHFEKMLYDQALISSALVEAWLLSHDEQFKHVATETLDFVLREMHHAEGGFYSAFDADSLEDKNSEKSAEGAHYLWKSSEINALFDDEEAAVFKYFYGVKKEGNVVNDPHNEFSGKNILHNVTTLAEAGEYFHKEPQEIASLLAGAKKKMLHARQQRPWPLLDDKILTSWNALMVSALAKAGRAFGRMDYQVAAQKAVAFVGKHLSDGDGRLMHSFRKNRQGEAGQLEDYAFFVHALLDLFETTQDFSLLDQADILMGKQIDLFWDEADGGFFESAKDADNLLFRMKADYDGAEPTGNSMAVAALQKLSMLTAKQEYAEKAEKTLALFSERLAEFPLALTFMLDASSVMLHPIRQVVVVGTNEEPSTVAMLKSLRNLYLPKSVVLHIDPFTKTTLPDSLKYLENMTMVDKKATAYVCAGGACLPPVTNVEELNSLLLE